MAARKPSTNGHVPGFRMPPAFVVLEFPEGSAYAGAEVRCYRTLSLGRALALRRLVESDEPDQIEAARLFAEEILVDWNLQDADGKRLEPSADAFVELPADFVNTVMRIWQEATTEVSAPLAPASPDGSPSAV